MNFHLAKLTTSEMAPLLKGFCGDFVCGVEQMAGTSHTPLRTVKTCEFKPINYYICLMHLSEQQSVKIQVHHWHFGVLQFLSHPLPISPAHQTANLLRAVQVGRVQKVTSKTNVRFLNVLWKVRG